jgi:hypothetical protein
MDGGIYDGPCGRMHGSGRSIVEPVPEKTSAQLLAVALRQQGYLEGWDACLKSVRASLRGYPEAGGDIEILREVDRIAGITEREPDPDQL